MSSETTDQVVVGVQAKWASINNILMPTMPILSTMFVHKKYTKEEEDHGLEAL